MWAENARLRAAIAQALTFHQTTHVHAVLREALEAPPPNPAVPNPPENPRLSTREGSS